MLKKKLLLFILIGQSVLIQSFSKVFFTPRDNIRSKLLDCIRTECKSIRAAIYMLTDKSVAEELLNAHVRGVDVNLILDSISMKQFGKGRFLKENGLPVLVHQPLSLNSYMQPIMHHKFFVFGGANSLCKHPFVWTGSFNPTLNAATQNDENAILSDDKEVVEEYCECFKLLRKRLQQKES